MRSMHRLAGTFGKSCVCLVFLAVYVLATAVPAVGQEHVWSERYGGSDHDFARSMSTDPWGNVFVTGDFMGSADFGGGYLTSAGDHDVFLAKYDADGNHIWSKRFGDELIEYAYGAAADGAGNVIIAGYFQGDLDFGGGNIGPSLENSVDIFVAKFDASGNHLWSRVFGSYYDDRGLGLDVDASGNIFLTGFFTKWIKFDMLPTLVAHGENDEDIYLVKFDSGCNALWSKAFGGISSDRGQSVAADYDGNVFVTGYFQGSVDFGGGTITSSGLKDIFLAKYGASTGSHMWSSGYGAGGSDEGACVCTDGSGNVFMTGWFLYTVDFGGGPIANNSINWSDAVLAKYSASGSHLWSHGLGGQQHDFGNAVVTDSDGAVFLTAVFKLTADFGGDPLTSAGGYDIALAKYGAAGDHLWSRGFGGSSNEEGYALTVDALDRVAMTGVFSSSSIDFGGGPLYSAGETDIFLTKHEGSFIWRGDVYIDEDVVVDAGKTLTVEPGTTVRIALADGDNKGSNPSKVEIIVNGELDVNGTASEPVVFRSATPVGKTDWVGIYFDDGAEGGDFEYCTIKHAEYAVETWIPIAFDNCVIDSAAYGGVVVQAGETTIDNTSIANGGCFGVFLGASTVTINGSSFDSNASAGVNLNGNDVLYVNGTSFSNNGKGLSLNNYAVAYIDDDCNFADNDYGVYVYQSSDVWIKNSTFEDNTTGIYCNHYSHAKIEGNAFTGNEKGIHCYDYSNPLIESNSITYNTTGIYAATNSEPDIGRAGISGHNSIHNNTGYHIVNATWGLTLMAEDNWWGSSRGPKAYKIIGLVDYEPWLTSVPLGASPYPGGSEDDDDVPVAFKLAQAYPNPFNPMTTIKYTVARPCANVRIAVYNVKGRLVKVLVDGHKVPGNHAVEWNGRDDAGRLAASSIYFIKMDAGEFKQTQKAVLIR